MSKYIYTKRDTLFTKKVLHFLGLGLIITGLVLGLYLFFPLISWQLYLQPAFASEEIVAPIPRTTILTPNIIKSLFEATENSLRGIDYNNAKNWFPTAKNGYEDGSVDSQVSSYTISIPKLNIENAEVTTVDNNLKDHLVNYAGTAIPPNKGNAVIFGHSTLPQWFNPKDYTAIFATAHTLKIDDIIMAHVADVTYSYRIFSITIVDATDTSPLIQDFTDSYLTLVTCTPPGTTWKRLIIKAKLEKM